MAAVLRSETTATAPTDATTPTADRRQWWESVQLGASAMLTDAAHPAVAHRVAG